MTSRLGIITVSNDPVPEMELWRQAKTPVSVHTTRFQLSRQPGEIYKGTPTQEMFDAWGMAEAVEVLAAIPVDGVGLCFAGSSIFSKDNFDSQFEEYVRQQAGCRAITSAQALVQGIKRRGLCRPTLIIPPWYSPETTDAFHAYLAEARIEIANMIHFKLSARWDEVQTQDLFDHGAVWDINPSDLVTQVAEKFRMASSDGVIIPGSGFPSLDSAKAMMEELEVPVLSANGAVLEWFTCQH